MQVEQLEKEAQSDRESLRSAEKLSSDLMKEKAQLQKTLETLRENSERQVYEKDGHVFTFVKRLVLGDSNSKTF